MDGHGGGRSICEPFKIRLVEPLPLPSREERGQALRKAGYNLFLILSTLVTFDFLSEPPFLRHFTARFELVE